MESQSEYRAVFVTIAILILAIGGVILFWRFSGQKNKVLNDTSQRLVILPSPSPTPAMGLSESSELKMEDIKIGSGKEAINGLKLTVHYMGKLTDGTEFDSSYTRGEPFTLTLGAGQVIKGWDQGLVGMKVGGKRKLTIPPQLGYGSQAQGSIPPNSTLIFEIELVKVE